MRKYLSFLLCLVCLFEVQALPILGRDLSSLMDSRSEREITFIATFKSPVYKNLAQERSSQERPSQETPTQVQSRKMQAAKLSQADFLKGFSLNKTSQVKNMQSLWINNSIIITGSSSLLSQLSKNEKIESLILDYEVTLEEPLLAKPIEESSEKFTYGLQKVRAPEVWEKLGITGKGITVGLLDTGYAKHPDLEGRVIKAQDFITRKADNKPNDGHGHGTHCLGTIGGRDTSGKAIGVAPDVKFIVGKIFSDRGSSKASAILNAMQWIADPDGNPDTADQPRVVNNSWGGRQRSMAQAKPQWDAVSTWREMGIVPVFAAGNSGPGANTVGTPGGFPHSFAIGATDKKDVIATFSSRGPTTWEGKKYIKPDVSAPGVGTYSAKHSGGYTAMSGTSMATPHVVGVIALMLQANPSLTVRRIEEILEKTSLDLGSEGKDSTYGSGRVDAFKAVTLASNGAEVKLKVKSPYRSVIVKILPDGQISRTNGIDPLSFSMAPGTYDFEISGFGAIKQIVTVKLKAKQKLSLEINLQAAPKFPVNFEMKDENNQPLSARISFPNTPLLAVKTHNGSLTLRLPNGDYSGVVSSLGFAKTARNFQVEGEAVRVSYTLKKISPVLVVADLAGAKSNIPYYYNRALAKLKREFDRIKIQSVHDSLTYADLMGYETVIWFTGDKLGSAIIKPEQEVLEAYVQGGGRLILTGQGISNDIDKTRFAKEVLGAVYKKEDPIFNSLKGLGLKLKLNGKDSSHQRHADVLKITSSSAKAILRYTLKGVAAVENSYGKGKLVFLGFGVEGVTGEENRIALLKALLERLDPSLQERLDRLETAYKNAPKIHEVLASRFKVTPENRSELLEYLKSAKTLAPYRAILAELQQ
jgi:subtilisin family serine protease